MTLEEFREDCLLAGYPIMSDESLTEISKYLSRKQEPNLLELGSCVGYSSIYLAMHSPASITSIERDFERHILAKENVVGYDLSARVQMVYDDALVYTPTEQFDVIVFDAAKAQNEAFFARYFGYLKPDGYLFIDNIDFHGFVKKREQLTDRRNLQKMVTHIYEFVEMLEKRPDIEIKHLDLGDGLLIITRRGNAFV